MLTVADRVYIRSSSSITEDASKGSDFSTEFDSASPTKPAMLDEGLSGASDSSRRAPEDARGGREATATEIQIQGSMEKCHYGVQTSHIGYEQKRGLTPQSPAFIPSPCSSLPPLAIRQADPRRRHWRRRPQVIGLGTKSNPDSDSPGNDPIGFPLGSRTPSSAGNHIAAGHRVRCRLGSRSRLQ